MEAAGPALPAWKRELLERKRAKLAGAEPEAERRVLAESLGPLRENPFMRLESERRRLRQGLPAGGRRGGERPLRELLELYSAVPGIRTIHADNVLIIESQPDAAAAACFVPGPPLAEIRAAHVLVYEPAEPAPPGMVSRLRQKFDQRPRGRRRRPGEREPAGPGLLPNGPASASARPGPPSASAPGQRAPGSPVGLAPWPAPPPASPPAQRASGSSVGPAPRQGPPPASPPAQRGPVPGSPVQSGSFAISPSTQPDPLPVSLRPLAKAGSSSVSPPAQRGLVPSSPVRPGSFAISPSTQPDPLPVYPRPLAKAGSSSVSPPAQRGPVPGSLVRPGSFAISPSTQPDPLPVSSSPLARAGSCSVSPPAQRRAVSPVRPPAKPGSLPISPSDQPDSVLVSPVSSLAQVGPSPGSPPAQPGPIPGSPVRPQVDGFLHRTGSNTFTVTPRGPHPASCAPLTNGPLEHVTSPGARAPPVPSPSASIDRANARRPKPERREESQPPSPSATPGPLQPLSASALRNGGSFEIRPAPKPDLAAIPAQDLQAQALANLRLNSRNSFLVVPRRAGARCPKEPVETLSPPKPECEQKEEPVSAPQTPQELLVPVTYIDEDIVELDAGNLPQEMGPAGGLEESKQPQEASSALGMEASALPVSRPHSVSSALQQRGGNTFTIVPKRKPPNSAQEVCNGASGAQQQEEEENEEGRSKGKTSQSPGEPQLDLGTLLKKRYPTVHEIEVIGGYLSLERSCMSKTNSRRKKMKISFNEASLQTMFEYPSESSLMEEEEEEDEEEEDSVSEDEDDDKPHSLFIPRPTTVMIPNVPTSGFSSYTPKHSVEFNKWQEQEYSEKPASAGLLLKEASPPGSQVMLTPADQTGLSDFSSEPALYF